MALPKKRVQQSILSSLLRQPRVTAAAASALLAGAVYFFVIGPMLENVRSGGPYDVKREKVNTEEVMSRSQLAEDLVRDYKAMTSEIKMKSQTALPAAPEIPALLAGLDKIVSVAGLKITAIDVSPLKEGLKIMPEVGVLNIAMNVSSGDYQAFKRLLVSLERNLRLTDVLSISFNPQSATYSINARAYYIRKADSPAAGAVAANQP
jgi:Tfp pilus assembly protein PilO